MSGQKSTRWHLRLAGHWRKIVLGTFGIAAVGGAVLIGTRLTVSRVTLDMGGQVWRYHTRAATVEELLNEAEVTIDPEDQVSPSLDTPLTDGMTITVEKAHIVALAVDGSVRQIRTQARSPLDILTEQGVTLGENDLILVDDHSFEQAQLAARRWASPPASIRVVRSHSITVLDGAQTHQLTTTAIDVGRALADLELDLYLADRIIPDVNTPVTEGMTIQIERALPITIIADGRQLATRAHGPTVGDALAMIGLAPVGRDYTIPALDTPLTANLTIRLVRVPEKPTTINRAYPSKP